jgi:hypothetical protein
MNSPEQRSQTRRTLHQTRSDTKIAECDRKLTQYRAALDAGADSATVAHWITDGGRTRRIPGHGPAQRPYD